MTTNIIQEFRRAPAATALMLITVALATALTTIGVAACFQVVQSSGTLFTQAVTPHLLQMHEGPIDRNQISVFVAQHPEITAFETKEIDRTIELTGVLSSCVMLLMKLVRWEAKLMYFSNTARAENPSSRTMIVEMKLGRARRKTSARVGARSSDTRI